MLTFGGRAAQGERIWARRMLPDETFRGLIYPEKKQSPAPNTGNRRMFFSVTRLLSIAWRQEMRCGNRCNLFIPCELHRDLGVDLDRWGLGTPWHEEPSRCTAFGLGAAEGADSRSFASQFTALTGFSVLLWRLYPPG